MNQLRRAELKKAHALNPAPIGVYAIRNSATGKVLIDGSSNPAGSLNRHRFDLQMGTHRNAALTADWKQFGASSFVFEIIDTIAHSTDPRFDPKVELSTLLAMHLEDCPRASANSYL